MNDIYSRNILKKLEKWAGRREIFAITGPRQSGKTTLMLIFKEHLLRTGVPQERIIFLNCDDFDAAEPFIRDPKAFVKSHAPDSKRYYFFLDEYQYVPEGGKKLKIIYDSFPNIKFIISGSSSLELKDKTAKYLVGRAFYFTLYPFSFGEFLNARDSRLGKLFEEKNKSVINFIVKGKDFSTKDDIFSKELAKQFEEYMVFGGYPEVIKTPDLETKKTVLKNIHETYINKDIIELLKITDVTKFRTIVRLLAAQHSGMLNFDSLASDSKSYYREVKRFLSVLEETYVLRLLSPFHRNISTELRKNPKAYFLDSGLRNYIVKNFNPTDFRDDRGKLAEGCVHAELANTLQEEAEIKYWRTLAKAEVDFVLLSGQSIIPLEVKHENFKKPKITRSLRNFIHEYKPERAIVITKDYWHSMKLDRTHIKFIPIFYL